MRSHIDVDANGKLYIGASLFDDIAGVWRVVVEIWRGEDLELLHAQQVTSLRGSASEHCALYGGPSAARKYVRRTRRHIAVR